MSWMAALTTYVAVRRHQVLWRRWQDVEIWRSYKLKRFLADDLPRVPAFRKFSGKATDLGDLPFMDKAVLMSDFAAYNLPGIQAGAAWNAFAMSKRIGDLTVGASTGTSGNRGLFVISETERFRWLGAMLAKALPGFWWKRHRVAVILPLNTPLYDSANQSRLLSLKFFDVTLGPESWVDALQSYAPTVIVAPPKILVWLVRHASALTPKKVYSAAETLDPLDREIIETRFGAPLGQIYMATEGLIAVSCRFGTLHLCDDTMFIELEPAGGGLVTPVITDFSRTTQIMARFRMNDLLRLSGSPCRCGSPLRAVAEVVGRQDDCFRLKALDGKGEIEITPDVLRNAIVDADRRITDYRLVQSNACDIELLLPDVLPRQAYDAAITALNSLLAQRGADARVFARAGSLPLETGRKLRRVERRWTGGMSL